MNSQINGTFCSNKFSPYIDNKINALNPCFLSLIYGSQAILFCMIGIIQFYRLIRPQTVPPNTNRNAFRICLISSSHIIHLTSISFQFILLYCQLYLTDCENITKLSISINILFILFISFPTQYFVYFYSICSLGSQLFYYLFQTIFLLYLLGQRFFHYPNEVYNLTKGKYSVIFEILLLFNSANILFYLSSLFEP
ncbi:uncharacterized protein PWA37_000578 [Arxiozyma heterogenica]|uniref:uncharacterized protein n=1 Tax=Arxiozyma heterogenica TaxID=278026 RepID=UPI002EFDF2E7